MERTVETNDRLADARRHVAALKGFYIHATVFVLVMLLLLAVNIVTTSPWWVQWPFLGWGIGLTGHAIGVFGRFPGFAKNWEARQIKAYLDKTPAGGKPPAAAPTGKLPGTKPFER